MSKKATGGKSGGKEKGAPKGPAVPAVDEEGFSNFSVQDDTTTLIATVEGTKKLYIHRDVLNVHCPGLREKLILPEGDSEPPTPRGTQVDTPKPIQEEMARQSQQGTPRGSQRDIQGESQREMERETERETDRETPRGREGVMSPRTRRAPLEITLEGKYEHVLELLKCLYPPHKPITDANVDDLLELIGEWDVQSLRERSEAVLMEREPSLKLLLQAQKSKLESVCEEVAKKLAEEHSIADLKKQDEEFIQLNFSNQAKLYRNRILHLEKEKATLDETSSLLYPMTKFVVPSHKCSSVGVERFGYLVITTTQDDGKKKRQKCENSALVYHNELDPKCKDCMHNYGIFCRSELTKLDSQGQFDHLKKKFESEKKSKAKPAGKK